MKYDAIKVLWRPVCTAILLAASAVAAQVPSHLASSTRFSLEDALAAADARQKAQTLQNDSKSPFRSSPWLAALPSVSLSYMGSDETQGTDETEVNVNLPVKSPYLAKQDRELRRLDALLGNADAERRQLFLSGLLRETLWSERIATTRLHYTATRITRLEQLYKQQEALLEARSSNRYSLLLLRQELADARLLHAEQAFEVAKWQARYEQVTGLTELPRDLHEPPPPEQDAWRQHPHLQILELGWQRAQAVLAASSAAAQNWNIAVQARQLDTPAFRENQYGLALEVPLSVFDVASASNDSDWREASRSYWKEKDTLQLQLAYRWQGLQEEASYLLEKQSLLEQSSRASEELLSETRLLLGENALAREVWLRRVLGDLDRQAAFAINELRIGQNRAMSRQAAGIPL